jgi:hypothetical protein
LSKFADKTFSDGETPSRKEKQRDSLHAHSQSLMQRQLLQYLDQLKAKDDLKR